MRLALAHTFGGGPAYWGLPEVADEETVVTALGVLARWNAKKKD